MRLALLLYLSIGTFLWFAMTGPGAPAVNGYHEGRYTALTMILLMLGTLLFWPRLFFGFDKKQP